MSLVIGTTTTLWRNNLFRRTLLAIIAIPILAALLLENGNWMHIALIFFTAVGWIEFHDMFKRLGYEPFNVLGVILTIIVVVTPEPFVIWRADFARIAVIIVFTYTLFVNREVSEKAVKNAVVTLVGIGYVGMLGYIPQIRNLPNGFLWIISAIALVAIADTGAYAVGKLFGGKFFDKLCPSISPKKTWEGLIGGFVLTIIGALLINAYLLPLPVWQWIALATIATVFGLFGDLAESRLKRAAGAENSGWIMLGHGGVLDRVDSWLFALPVTYYFIQFVTWFNQ